MTSRNSRRLRLLRDGKQSKALRCFRHATHYTAGTEKLVFYAGRIAPSRPPPGEARSKKQIRWRRDAELAVVTFLAFMRGG